jgi:hypothetical protein
VYGEEAKFCLNNHEISHTKIQKKMQKKNSIAVERIIQKKKKNPAKIIPEMRTFALLQKQGICVSGREIETKMEAGPSFPDKV